MTTRLIGRDAELRVAAGWLDRLGEGPSALVIAGDAGFGKTALWDAVCALAGERGLVVRTSRAVESETQAGLVALADLVADDASAGATDLPQLQRRALESLLGADVEPVDVRPLGSAVRALLARRAAGGPVVLAIDDAQWVDTSSRRALDFALRRLAGLPVAVLATVRTNGAAEGLPLGLDRSLPTERIVRVHLGPLSLGALHQLIAARTGQSLSRPALTRLERACQGSPLLALEIVSTIVRSGAAVTVESVLPVPADVRLLALARLASLPPGTRSLVELLSALARPNAAVLRRAIADPVDLDDHLAIAEEAGLLDLAAGIRFQHPLQAAAVYEAMARPARQGLHRGLAAIVHDPEEQARHLALATILPDEAVAARLGLAAERAMARGAPDAAIELSGHARRLTPPEEIAARGRRSMLLAQALWDIGESARSGAVLGEVIADLPAGTDRATARLLRAVQLAWDGREDDAMESCRAALDEAQGDRRLEATAHLRMAYLGDRDIPEARRHAELALASLRQMPAQDRDVDLLACALLFTAEYRLLAGDGFDTASVDEARAILPAQISPARPLAFYAEGIARERLWLWMAAMDEVVDARRILETQAQHDRDAGTDRPAPIQLADLAELACLMGDLPAARAYASDALERAGDRATVPVEAWVMARLGMAMVAAHEGELDRARAFAADIVRELAGHDGGQAVVRTRALLGFVELSAGRPAEARGHLAVVATAVQEAGTRDPAAFRFEADHIESLILCGDIEVASRRLADFEPSDDDPRPWRRATAARCRALLAAATGEAGAADLADEAVARHDSLGMPVELGRALLLAGRLHRARKGKRLAAERLTRAIHVFESAGALAWRDRARAELGRVGLRPRAPRELTATESEVATLAAQGLTNRQVADALVMSPRSIDAVLGRVYQKLEIRSRAELGARFAVPAQATEKHR